MAEIFETSCDRPPRPRSSSWLAAPFLAAVAFSACQPELPARSEVSGLRVLAIKAEPPEVLPGEFSVVTALVADPYGEGRALDWVLTLCTPSLETGGCLEYNLLLETYPNPDLAQSYYAQCCLRGSTETPEAGVLELGGGARSAVVTAQRMLDDLDDRSAQEGLNAQLTLLACESGVCTAALGDSGSTSPDDVTLSLPPEQSAVAVKRIRVSSAEARNENPELERLVLDDRTYQDGQELQVVAGRSYTFRPELDEASIETYTYIKTDGTTEQRVESPYYSWYATQGEFEENFSEATGGEDGSNLWTAPTLEEAFSPEVTMYVVVWDRRGGIDWLHVRILLTGE